MNRCGRSFLLILLLSPVGAGAAGATRSGPLERCQQAVVKVYGAGGVAGLEGYQSGVFLRGTPARVVSIDSALFEEDSIALVDAHGDRCQGRLLGRDGVTGLVLIACPEAFSPPATIDLSEAVPPVPGRRVWIVSNTFGIATGDEPVTVQRGHIGALARMPTSAVNAGAGYRPPIGAPSTGTPVLLLDAVTSNPGTGGGGVFSLEGDLLGIVGAECRSPATGAWINYALPAASAAEAVQRITERAGTASRDPAGGPRRRVREAMRSLGLRLIPAITPRAPAYIEHVSAGGPAQEAGCLPDDLIVAVAGVTVGNVEAAQRALAGELDRSQQVELLVLRDNRLVALSVVGVAP